MQTLRVLAFVGIIAVASAGLIKGDTEEEKLAFRVIHKRCQDDPRTVVDEALITKLFQGIFIEDKQLKIHMVCMAKGWNHMDANGNLNHDSLKNSWAAHYDGQDYQNLLKCLVKKPTPEETYFEVVKCKHNTVAHLN